MDSEELGDVPLGPIEADRGVPFLMFPPERPLPIFRHKKGNNVELKQIIKVRGLGEVSIFFSGILNFEDDLRFSLEDDRRIVVLTNEGPISLARGQNTSTDAVRRLLENGATEWVNCALPSSWHATQPNQTVRLIAPRFEAELSLLDDNDIEGDKLYLHKATDSEGVIDHLMLPINDDLLHSLQLEIP